LESLDFAADAAAALDACVAAGSALPAGLLGAAGSAALGAPEAPRLVPSTMIAAPQRLQVMRTLRPRTLSSGTAYLAGQLAQAMFMEGTDES
jgi:hypothetical protein